MLFAFAMIPLLLLMGGAVDFARYARYKAELANAVDAAALALAKQHSDFTAAQATTFVNNYVSAFAITDSQFTVSDIAVTKLTNGFHVSAVGSMKTVFLPIGRLVKSGGGIYAIGTDIVAEVVNSSNRVELALVLDNTGSMNCGTTVSGSCTGNWSSPSSSSRIAGLKTAANALINILMTGTSPDPDLVKIAVVPFEGTVNTGYSSNNVPSWIDWNDTGKADWTGVNLNKRDTSTGASCTSGSNCKYIGHKWLFDKLHARNSNVKWEGCVEMRASPYDILDTTPTSATPDTLYVPFFWPDEPDSNNDGGYGFQNNYLNDKGTFTTGGGWWHARGPGRRAEKLHQILPVEQHEQHPVSERGTRHVVPVRERAELWLPPADRSAHEQQDDRHERPSTTSSHIRRWAPTFRPASSGAGTCFRRTSRSPKELVPRANIMTRR